MISMSRAFKRWFIALAVVIVAAESLATLVCSFFLAHLHLNTFVWAPDFDLARKNWTAFASSVDETIGFVRQPSPKPNPEFGDQSAPCGSVYGDSFVYGAEVPPADGWVEQLSHALDCRMLNYGVGGDGTDQALLRFRETEDGSPVAVLGIHPGAVEDIVSQYVWLPADPPDPAQLKGRFLLSRSGQLEWTPPPQFDADSFVAMLHNPAKALPNSYFLPDTPDGPVTLEFPYSLTLMRIPFKQRVRNVLSRRADWSSFYTADHSSGGLQLMAAIAGAFVDLAQSRGQRALIVMLPVQASFREQANHGAFEYAPLLALLRAKNIDVFDPGEAMLAALAGRPICDFFTIPRPETALVTAPVACGGHYSSFGNATMAELVVEEFRRRGFIAR
jgi:hypothetical protein